MDSIQILHVCLHRNILLVWPLEKRRLLLPNFFRKLCKKWRITSLVTFQKKVAVKRHESTFFYFKLQLFWKRGKKEPWVASHLRLSVAGLAWTWKRKFCVFLSRILQPLQPGTERGTKLMIFQVSADSCIFPRSLGRSYMFKWLPCLLSVLYILSSIEA